MVLKRFTKYQSGNRVRLSKGRRIQVGIYVAFRLSMYSGKERRRSRRVAYLKHRAFGCKHGIYMQHLTKITLCVRSSLRSEGN